MLNSNNKSGRDIGLDITRIIAFLCVPCVHFFANSDYYSMPTEGGTMYLMTVLRGFFMVCVPLFIILSGYLMISKRISMDKKGIMSFYTKLSKVLITYLLASVILMAFQIFYQDVEFSLKTILFGLLKYDFYAWYINMYIGLYLLIPFLNAMWRGIGEDNKSGHAVLVGVLIVLTILPSVVNVYDFFTPGALMHPNTSTTQNAIVPDWWNNIYPITYYFIGAYLRSHVDSKKFTTWKLCVAFVLSGVLFGLYNIWRCNHILFIWGNWSYWNSYQCVIMAVLAFMIINSVKYPRLSSRAEKVIGLISGLTLGAYLVSWMPDQIVHNELISRFPDMKSRLMAMPAAVCFTVVISMIVSLIIHFAVTGIMRICKKRKNGAKV